EAGSAREEVDKRDGEFEGGSESPVVRLVNCAGPVVIGEPVVRLDIGVGRARRGLDGECCRPALDGGTINALLVVEERNAAAAEGEAFGKHACVWKFLSVLGLEYGETRKAGRPNVLVPFHVAILRTRTDRRQAVAASTLRIEPFGSSARGAPCARHRIEKSRSRSRSTLRRVSSGSSWYSPGTNSSSPFRIKRSEQNRTPGSRSRRNE